MVDGDDVDMARLDRERDRYPFCVVWTPIPLLTWLFPFLGHTGIGLSDGVIRDFAGPYYVSEDHMAFGSPTRYLQLDPDKVEGGQVAWDRAVQYASDVYSRKMDISQTEIFQLHNSDDLVSYVGKLRQIFNEKLEV